MRCSAATAIALDGGIGKDELTGGAGNDTYLFGRGYGTDRIWETHVSGGTIETVKLAAGIVPGDVSLYQEDNVLALKISGCTDELQVLSFFVDTANGQPYDNKIERVAFDDGTVWDLNTTKSKIVYQGTANAMVGTAGNDTLDGSSGADIIYGGSGDDTYILPGYVTFALVTEMAGEGLDTIICDWGGTLPDNFENLTIHPNRALYRTPEYLTGNALDNRLVGGDYGDIIDGGLGADAMVGGRGSDTYFVDNAGDQVKTRSQFRQGHHRTGKCKCFSRIFSHSKKAQRLALDSM